MMKTRTLRILASGTSLALALASVPLFAASPVRYESAPEGHAVEVEGTSNIHDWTGTTDQITGWIQIPGQWTEDDGEIRLAPALQGANDTFHVHAQIPTGTLKGNRRGLASNMHKALKVSSHPHVTFTLEKINGSRAGASGAAIWSVVGDLEIAGDTRSVNLELTVTPLSGDRVRVDVSKDLLMTDFGIDPPRAMMGMARAANEVDVQITWILQRQTPQPTLPSDARSDAHRQAMSTVLKAYEQARAALAAGDLAKAQPALAQLSQGAEALAALDEETLSEAVRSDWASAAARLEGAAANAAQARAIGGARASFAVLSQAVVQAVSIVGHDHDAPLVAYRHADQRGMAGAGWVQASDEAGAAVRSPYASGSRTSQPEVTAIYPGQRPVVTATP